VNIKPQSVFTGEEFAIVIVHHTDIEVAVVWIIVAINSKLLSDSCCHNIETVYTTVLNISDTCDICGGIVCFIRSMETTPLALSQGVSLGAFQA
jgi:hypothetical protein